MSLLPSFCNFKICIAFTEHPTVNLLSRIIPGSPFCKITLAFRIFTLSFLSKNHAPGLGLNALIFAIIFSALSFQFIRVSILSIFFDRVFLFHFVFKNCFT